MNTQDTHIEVPELIGKAFSKIIRNKPKSELWLDIQLTKSYLRTLNSKCPTICFDRSNSFIKYAESILAINYQLNGTNND